MLLHSIIFTLLIALAAMFKAISDLCADTYDISIFSRMNPNFWDKNISANNKWIGGNKANGHKKGWRYWDPISDAWHISNFAMISCFIGAAFFTPLNLIHIFSIAWLNHLILFGASGILFTVVFNTFYNHVFKKK